MNMGYMNFLLKCSANTDVECDEDGQERIVIRVFGEIELHRESEIYFMRKLTEKGIIPPIYCR